MGRAYVCALLASFCLLSTSPGSAQDPVNPEAAQNLICNRGSSCGFGYINGRKYETLSDGKTSVVIVEDVFGKYFRADVFVLNLGTRPVDVLPSNFVLTELAPKSKVLKFVDGDKLVRSEERRLAWGNALTSMGGNMARQQTTTNTYSSGTVRANGSDGSSATGSYTGTATTTTSSPDYAAQARAAQTIKMRNEAFASFANATGRTMLRANTAPTNQSVQGFVLFERDKKAKSIMLSCIVGNTVYQFPFDLTVR